MFNRLFGKPKVETNTLHTLDKLNEVSLPLFLCFQCQDLDSLEHKRLLFRLRFVPIFNWNLR